MNATTNISSGKPPRMNKITTTVIIGAATLILGLFLGGAAAETGSMPNLTRKAQTVPAQTPATATSNLKTGDMETWNPFQEMRDMQARIDQSINQMYERFRSEPQLSGFKDFPGYSLSLDVRDLKHSYEIQADLPDTKASDVHVSVKNGQTLNVEINRKQTETSDQKNAATSVVELGQYEQSIQLPTPVKADQMKIQREGHELIITIPKAA